MSNIREIFEDSQRALEDLHVKVGAESKKLKDNLQEAQSQSQKLGSVAEESTRKEKADETRKLQEEEVKKMAAEENQRLKEVQKKIKIQTKKSDLGKKKTTIKKKTLTTKKK